MATNIHMQQNMEQYTSCEAKKNKKSTTTTESVIETLKSVLFTLSWYDQYIMKRNLAEK